MHRLKPLLLCFVGLFIPAYLLDITSDGSSGRAQAVADDSNWSSWETPINLGSPVNSAADELLPYISRDHLNLYFRSDRPGGQGGGDIWVSSRGSLGSAWDTPLNVSSINTSASEQAPALSPDEHRLFFDTDVPGGCGGRDLYLSRRGDLSGNLGWGAPVNLGCVVNSSVRDSGPSLFEDDRTGRAFLFFVREPGEIGGADIYSSDERPDGTFGPATLVSELSSPFLDRTPRVSRDGLMMLLSSNRPGGLGGVDIWISSRLSTNDPWNAPVNIGAPINSEFADGTPAMSAKTDALYFFSDRPGTLGGDSFGGDLYVSFRHRIR